MRKNQKVNIDCFNYFQLHFNLSRAHKSLSMSDSIFHAIPDECDAGLELRIQSMRTSFNHSARTTSANFSAFHFLFCVALVFCQRHTLSGYYQIIANANDKSINAIICCKWTNLFDEKCEQIFCHGFWDGGSRKYSGQMTSSQLHFLYASFRTKLPTYFAPVPLPMSLPLCLLTMINCAVKL